MPAFIARRSASRRCRSAATAATRQLAVAEFASAIGVWGTVLVLAVHAWHEAGPSAVGLMGLCRAAASGFGGPLLGGLAHRASRRHLLVVTNVLRTGTVAAMAALVIVGAPFPVMFVLMAMLGLLDPMFESVSGTLLTEIVDDPSGLAPANARVSVATNGGFLLGSVGAGLVVAAMSTSVALCVLAGVFAVSLVPLSRLRIATPVTPPHSARHAGSIGAVRDLARTGGLREAAGFLSLLSMTDGAVDVLGVCAALGYLGAGDAGAGLLQAVIGAGTIAGSMVFVSSRKAHRMTAGVVVGSIVLAGSLVTVGAVGGIVAVMAILGVGGIGYSVAEVGSLTLVQRRAAADRRVRVLGMVLSMKAVSYAAGAALAGVIAARLGARLAFVWIGAGALLVTAALSASLTLVDRSAKAVRAVPADA